MAALGIVGLAIASASNLRTVLESVRQRYEHFSENEQIFEKLITDLADITRMLEEIERKVRSTSREENEGLVRRRLNRVKQQLLVSLKIMNKFADGPLQMHSGPSCLHLRGRFRQITNANRIHDELNKVSTNLGRVDDHIGPIAALLGISELLRTQTMGQAVDSHVGRYNVPILTHQEVLDFDGKDETGTPTPEAQMKMHILDKTSTRVTAAAGRASGKTRAKVPSAKGMAGVGKSVALKGLGWDTQVREAFDDIHYITLGHDATERTVVRGLARIVNDSGGQRESSKVRSCKNVSEAVSLTSKWFSGRKCLFLIDDLWKVDQNKYGYLPALTQLLSSSERSRIAITTRDTDIASEAGASVEFGPRGLATSRKMFLMYFKGKDAEISFFSPLGEQSVAKILDLCAGLPLALAITGRGARELKNRGRSTENAVAEYAARLHQRKSELLDEPCPSYGRDDDLLALRSAIDTSLDLLSVGDKAGRNTWGVRFRELYQALGVLKAQTWAPLSMLSKLWNVDREDAKVIMGEFCLMSLAETKHQTYSVSRSNEERAEDGLKIHDLQLQYCRQSCKEIDIWHGKLLDKYVQGAEDTIMEESADPHEDPARYATADATINVEPRPWWSEKVVEDGYVHEHIAWHLVKAGRRDELRSLLIDARWIKLRLHIGGVVALHNDFEEAMRMNESGTGALGSPTKSCDAELQVLLNALKCSWHYVAQNGRELAAQLGGGLFDVQDGNAAASKLVKSAVKHNERPFAEALNGFLPDARSGQVSEVHFCGSCSSFSYSRCGKYIAVGVEEDVVVVKADTLVEKRRLKGHNHLVSSVCWLPQSKKIVYGSSDNTVRVWDLNKPDGDAFTFNGHTEYVNSVCASADGSRIASGSRDKTIRVWNLKEETSAGEAPRRRSKWITCFCFNVDIGSAVGECKVLRGHYGGINCVRFSPTGALLASASDDRTVKLWNGHTGEDTGVVYDGHEHKVMCVAFSPDGERLASGCSGGTIHLWLADSGASAGIVINGHSDWVRSVAFSADGTRIVSTSWDLTAQLWSAETGAEIGAALIGHTEIVQGAVFCPDDAHVASVAFDGTLRIWDPLNADGGSAARREQSRITSVVSFSGDGARVAIGCTDGTIIVRDTQSGRVVVGPLEGHASLVSCVTFSTDGALLASASDDGTVRLWDLRTSSALGGFLEGHKDRVSKVMFSADGSQLVSHSWGDDSRCLWAVASGARLWRSHGVFKTVANVLSDAQARAAIEAIESREMSSEEAPDVYYDCRESAVKMRRNDGDVCLVSVPTADIHNTHNTHRDNIVVVLRDGEVARLKLLL